MCAAGQLWTTCAHCAPLSKGELVGLQVANCMKKGKKSGQRVKAVHSDIGIDCCCQSMNTAVASLVLQAIGLNLDFVRRVDLVGERIQIGTEEIHPGIDGSMPPLCQGVSTVDIQVSASSSIWFNVAFWSLLNVIALCAQHLQCNLCSSH